MLCSRLIAVFIVVLSCTPAVSGDSPVRISLQPLGPFDSVLFSTISAGITRAYPGVEVVVQPQMPLPSGAFYEARKRYRAEKLLDHLDSTAAPGITKTVGLTMKDISTTKGEHEDWGIFGLGAFGGPSCVVSAFRLQAGNASPALLKERLVKTVVHELGHTFGLDHCRDGNCTMADACGSIRTVDEDWNGFCERCRKLVDVMVRVHSK